MLFACRPKDCLCEPPASVYGDTLTDPDGRAILALAQTAFERFRLNTTSCLGPRLGNSEGLWRCEGKTSKRRAAPREAEDFDSGSPTAPANELSGVRLEREEGVGAPVAASLCACPAPSCGIGAFAFGSPSVRPMSFTSARLTSCG